MRPESRPCIGREQELAEKSLGEVQVRRSCYKDGLALLQCSPHGVSGVLPFPAKAKLHLGRYAEARTEASQAVVRARRANHRWGIGFSLFVNGLAALAEGSSRSAPPVPGVACGL